MSMMCVIEIDTGLACRKRDLFRKVYNYRHLGKKHETSEVPDLSRFISDLPAPTSQPQKVCKTFT